MGNAKVETFAYVPLVVSLEQVGTNLIMQSGRNENIAVERREERREEM